VTDVTDPKRARAVNSPEKTAPFGFSEGLFGTGLLLAKLIFS